MNSLVGAAVALVAAVFSLVIADTFTLTGIGHSSRGRVMVLVGALAVLYGATLLRGRVHRHTGTLFYVRMLDEAMTDRHAEPLDIARRRRLSLKSVTRWVDLPARANAAGVIDLTGDCEQVAAALEAVVNADRDDTAYTIAPNMPWQAALAVGAELPLVERLSLLELSGQPPGITAPTGGEVTLILPRIGTTPATPWTVNIAPESGPLPHPSPDSGRVGLVLAFARSAARPTMQPPEAFAGFGVSTFHRLSPAGVDPADLSDLQLNSRQLTTLAAALADAVADIKEGAGTRELVVAAALPKTLAMALGWHLAQGSCRFFTDTYLLHFATPDGPFQPVRVHPSQPTGSPLTVRS